MLVDVLVQANPALGGLLEAKLESAKQTGATWDANGHEAELTEELLPFLGADAGFPAKLVEDLHEACLTVRR